jgi:fatty-acyl-CoA synthase
MTSLDTDIALVRRQTLGDLLHRSAARHPDRVAITDGRVTRTYEDLDGDANRLAHALIERGVEVGDRVAVLSRNSVAYVQTIFAVSRCGAVLVPINFMLNGAEVGYLLQHSGSTALVAQDELMATAEAGIEATGTVMPVRVVVGDRAHMGWEPLDALLAHPDAADPAVPVAAEAPAQVMYTSGTESRPKGAVLSHSALIAQYASCIIDGGMGPSDVDLHALPLYHCAQQHCFLLPEIYLGARGVIPPSTDPAVLLEMIERYEVNRFFAPPTVWIALLRHPDFDRRDLSSLRKGYYGAAIMPVEVLKEIGERLRGPRRRRRRGVPDRRRPHQGHDQVRRRERRQPRGRGSALPARGRRRGGRRRHRAPDLDRGGRGHRGPATRRGRRGRRPARARAGPAGAVQGAQGVRTGRGPAEERQREAAQARPA